MCSSHLYLCVAVPSDLPEIEQIDPCGLGNAEPKLQTQIQVFSISHRRPSARGGAGRLHKAPGADVPSSQQPHLSRWQQGACRTLDLFPSFWQTPKLCASNKRQSCLSTMGSSGVLGQAVPEINRKRVNPSQIYPAGH